MRRSATIRYGAGRMAVAAAALAAAWAGVTLVSGGFAIHAGAIALSSRDPLRPLLVAIVLAALGRMLLRGAEFRLALRGFTGDRGQLPARIAGAAALAVLIASIAWNTRAAGGSDSSCYVLQAEAFAHGQLTLTDPLSRILPDATSAMFAPAGFVPSRIVPFAAVPICGPGLALIMAAVSFAGRSAIFLVVPAFAALVVWVTFLVGRRLDDGVTGATAAVLIATSPIFLYQSVQPMSDVPAAALWLTAVALLCGGARPSGRACFAAGMCASAAVLLRPNIALIVLPLLALLRDRRGLLSFALGAIPGVAAMAWLNAARYGSPLASGYGSADVLFSFAHVGPNVARYPRWLFGTETPFIAAAALSPWWAWRHRSSARLVGVLLCAIALTVATYLAYTVFDDWWYIRFLLPALPLLVILSVAVVLEFVRGFGRGRAVAAVAIAAVLGAWHLQVARTRLVFDLQSLESRFVVTGKYAARALPVNAVVLAVQQSGSVRYYAGRTILAWDAIPPEGLDRTIESLGRSGRPVFIVLEDEEVPRFRARFAAQRLGGLDWPPRAEVHAPVRVHVYEVEARDRYRGGGAVTTEHVR